MHQKSGAANGHLQKNEKVQAAVQQDPVLRLHGDKRLAYTTIRRELEIQTLRKGTDSSDPMCLSEHSASGWANRCSRVDSHSFAFTSN